MTMQKYQPPSMLMQSIIYHQFTINRSHIKLTGFINLSNKRNYVISTRDNIVTMTRQKKNIIFIIEKYLYYQSYFYMKTKQNIFYPLSPETLVKLKRMNQNPAGNGFLLRRHITFMSNIFQVFGICTIFPNSKKNIKYFYILGSIFNLLILSGIIFVLFYYDKKIFYQRDIIGKFTDVIELAFPIFAHIISIIETLVKRKEHLKIWEKIIEANQILDEFKSFLNKKQEKLFYRKFFLLNIISFGSELLIIYYTVKTNDHKWMKHWLVRLFSNFIQRLHNLHFILYVDLILSRFHVIHEVLRDISFRDDNQNIYDKLKKIKSLHSNFWSITESLTSRFGWSLLASITNYFVCLTVDFYWMFVHLGRLCKYLNFPYKYSGKKIIKFLQTASVLCIVGPSLCVFYLFKSADDLLSESKLTPKLLHRFRIQSKSSNINKLVNLGFNYLTFQ